MTRTLAIAIFTCIIFGLSSIVSAEKRSSQLRQKFSSEKIVPGGEITVNGRTFRIADHNKSHSIKTRDLGTGGKVITDAPGEKQIYSKSSYGYYYYGKITPSQDSDFAAEINWDGNNAYLYNIMAFKETESYVVASKQEDKLVMQMGQTVAEEDGYDVVMSLLKTVIDLQPNPEWRPGDAPEDEYIGYLDFVYSTDYSSVYYTIDSNGTLTLELPIDQIVPEDDPDYVNPSDFDIPGYILGFYTSDDMIWTGDGDFFQEYVEFNYQRVEEPAGIEYTIFSYLNSYDEGVAVEVGRVDNAIYFKGLAAWAPESLFRANLVKDGDSYLAYIPQYQWVGTDDTGIYNLLTRTYIFNEKSGMYVEAPDDVDAIFHVKIDQETGQILSITSDDGNTLLAFSYATSFIDPLDIFSNLNLKSQDSFAGTPSNPYDAYTGDYKNWLGASFLFFWLDTFSITGTILDVEALYYRVFLNGEVYTFMQEDGENLKGEFITKYLGITEPTTLVPYTFSNGMDLWFDDGGCFIVGLYVEYDEIESLGVQAVYKYDGLETYSDIITLTLKDTGVNNIHDKTSGSFEYYDLNGNRVSNPEKGIYIKRSVFSDGTVRSEKIIKH